MELLGGLVVLEDRAAVGANQVIGARYDRVEDDIHVERRAEGLAHRSERCQLADRASQFAVTRLQLFKEPDVLDGDDRLVGEGLQEFHFDIRKAAWLRAGYADGADGLPLP